MGLPDELGQRARVTDGENTPGNPVQENTLDEVLYYLRHKIYAIPIPLGEKAPKHKGWQKDRNGEEDWRRIVSRGPCNVGLLNGEASDGLLDVDLDCQEAVQMANQFLPDTGWKSGRESKPYSHWWYRCQGAKTTKYQDVASDDDKSMLVETRFNRTQTVVPPSIHPSREHYVWHERRELAVVDWQTLARRVSYLAAAALLARHWPKDGSRHDATLAVAGFLLRGGVDVEWVKRIVGSAARCAGDEEAQDRLRAVETTAEKIKGGEPATGGPTAAEHFGAAVLQLLTKWLNLGSVPLREGKQNQASLLVKLADCAELFCSPTPEAFITFPVGGHLETWPVRRKCVRLHLAAEFYKRHGKAVGGQAMQDALALLEARAFASTVEKQVYIRVGEADGHIYLDLVNDKWEAIRITPDGWSVVSNPPLKFCRAKAMLPLPVPVPGGSIQELRPFLNVPSPTAWVLILSWLVGAFRPTRPYPLIALNGEQGCGKSTMTDILRSLIDPNVAGRRSQPRKEHDLVIAASNSWVLSFDNLSNLPHWLSDALCRMSTGGGYGTRELYSDAEEVIFNSQRPGILNGIPELATSSDLVDRTIMLTLPAIPKKDRRTEKEFWKEFNELRPRILGALLDAVSVALRRLPEVYLPEPPRMADFAQWATAAEPGLGLADRAFLDAFTSNQAEGHLLALEASPVARAVTLFMTDKVEWEGTAADLRRELSGDEIGQSHLKEWPQDARNLSVALRRLAPNLREAGIDVQFFKADRQRKVVISSTAHLDLDFLIFVSSPPERRCSEGSQG